MSPPDITMSTVDIKPIKTQRVYRRALKEIEGLMTEKRNTLEKSETLWARPAIGRRL